MTLNFHSWRTLRALLAAAILTAACPARAEDIDALPATVTFVISTGYWEDAGGDAAAAADTPDVANGTTKPAATRKGYYKLVALRQPDRTARVYLQQVALAAAGPAVISSVEIEQLTALKPYVTDIRPESSSGVTTQPGLFATVYLKTEPDATEAESWTVVIDDLGEMIVERATN